MGEGDEKCLKKMLYCIGGGDTSGFTRIQFYQHMLRKKTLITP